MKQKLYTLSILLLTALLPISCGYGHMGPGGMMGYGGTMGGYYGFGGSIMWIILLLVVAAIAFIWLQQSKKNGGNGWMGTGPRETPLDILKKRYASGEIDRETFERLKKEITEQ